MSTTTALRSRQQHLAKSTRSLVPPTRIRLAYTADVCPACQAAVSPRGFHKHASFTYSTYTENYVSVRSQNHACTSSAKCTSISTPIYHLVLDVNAHSSCTYHAAKEYAAAGAIQSSTMIRLHTKLESPKPCNCSHLQNCGEGVPPCRIAQHQTRAPLQILDVSLQI